MSHDPTPGTVAALLAAATARLRGNSSSPRLDAELLLAHALGCGRARLLAWPDASIEPPAAERFDALAARRAAGEPLAYLTGRRGFWTLTLAVDAHVLVPRPETELLVELALRLLPDIPARVLDLGTGSGAIALALASERPLWGIGAVDRSAAALAVARTNAARLGIEDVEFLQGSWYGPVAGRRFDAILANPPYLAAGDPHLRDDGVAFEPAGALVAGPTGLEDLAAIAAGAAAHLEPGAPLMVEHGAMQDAAVRELLAAAGLTGVRTQCDLAGQPRVTLGFRPQGETAASTISGNLG
jgi:release factor glutamine methyltransferase